jgi:xyloglucan-specific exo-beta-1,4-glucanase
MRNLSRILICAISLCSLARADEPYVWRNVKVGAGGFIPGIVFSRVEKGLVYLRSDMGGCYRWDDSAKRWIPLQDAIGVSTYHGVESIAPDPRDPNVVYAACGMYRGEDAAILRSRDRGKTWDVFPVPFRMGGNEDGRGLGERLAVDPNDTNILYFGSRHDGLQRSTDHGQTWRTVESFPVKGLGTPTWREPTHVGLSFVVFDPTSGSTGTKSKSIFVGVADPGERHLFRSDDAGETWNVVPGAPGKHLLPAQAQIDDAGATLYITYGNNIGPNGVTDGAVWKLDTRTGQWTDITPDKRPNRPQGGYMGLSLDRQKPGTLAVATMNRWGPVDTVWRSTDGGATWKDIVERSTRDVSETPFLLWGRPEAKLGWWMAALAIDPFDSDHAAYATGATIFATRDFSKVNADEPTRWKPWIEGIEQTAVL